jgi:hypothetical protein
VIKTQRDQTVMDMPSVNHVLPLATAWRSSRPAKAKAPPAVPANLQQN